jgi:hypothetical protein
MYGVVELQRAKVKVAKVRKFKSIVQVSLTKLSTTADRSPVTERAK